MPMSWPICSKRIIEIVCRACAARLLPRGIDDSGESPHQFGPHGTQFADSLVFN